MSRWTVILPLLVLSAVAVAQSTRPAATQPALHLDAALPTIFLAGDSTAQVGDPLHTGWGKTFADYVDPKKANWVNAALGGRSSRTFVSEGHWDQLVANLKPGDFVLIQFGHNDGGAVNDASRARGSLPGLGNETQEIDNQVTHQHEIVHTFGWYMTKMVQDTKAKGAWPILISITVRDIWTDGHVERNNGQFSAWTKQVAAAQRVPFIDLSDMVADRYEQMGEAAVKPFFPADTTHTNPDGAALNAQMVLAGVKALHRQNIIGLLTTPVARDVNPATQPSVVLGANARGNALQTANFLNWPTPADDSLPNIILIGDSTVRNGRGDGATGLGDESKRQWGWGEALPAWIDPHKANLVNHALGGTSAKSYMTEWPGALAMVKKGDFVLMQFGTNILQGEIRGIADDTDPNATNHSFGWYLRIYISDVRAKGATPIVCTMVPHNSWDATTGKITRKADPADWARAIAKEQNAPLLDLYEGAAERYDALGRPGATAVFADGGTHTNMAGANLLASVVVDQLKALPVNPLADYLRDKPAPTW